MPAAGVVTPLPESNSRANFGLGPAEPGLAPITSRETVFNPSLDYRAYSLLDTRAVLRSTEVGQSGRKANRLRALLPPGSFFEGHKAISLLGFLTEYKRGCDQLEIFEGMAVAILHFFLGKEPQQFAESLRRVGLSGTHQVTWPTLVNEFIERYLTDEVLEEAYDAVVRTAQRPNVDELAYSERLRDAALACPNVFAESQLINLCLKGLHAPIQARVPNNSDGKSYPALAHFALKHGKSYRAERKGDTHRGSSSKYGKSPRVLLHRHARYDARDYAKGGSDNSDEDFEQFEPDPDREQQLLVTPDQVRSSDKPSASQCPSTWLKPNERKLAQDSLPKSTDGWRCWLCREYEHSMFDCPYITEEQRTFAAYPRPNQGRPRSTRPNQVAFTGGREPYQGESFHDEALGWTPPIRDDGPQQDYPETQGNDPGGQ